MSKLPISGVAVTVLFNVVVAAAPNISDENKRAIFVYAVPLLVAACIWWVWEYFRTRKVPPKQPQHSTNASGVSGSNVATAGRDVHQTIYNHPPPPPDPPPQSGPSLSLNVLTNQAAVEVARPDFFYHGAGSRITLKPVIPPGKNYSVALIEFRLEFTNGGGATAYNLSGETYSCWIHDEPLKAELIDIAKSVGRTPPGQGKSIVIIAERKWDKPTGFHSLNIRKNQLTLLVEISFRVGSSDGPIHANEPIWLTWTPEVVDRMTDATEADVAIASPLIEELKAANARQPS